MFPTPRCLAAKPPGFLKRSTQELSRLTRIAWNTEALSTPTKPYNLLDFEDETTVASCKTFADRAVGGYSTANLDYVPANASQNTPAHARFHGSISTKLPPNWRVERTGYAAFRNKDRGFWLFGRLFWNIDPYTYLALRVKSDGRRYTVNIQTDSIVETDIHQHRLYTRHHIRRTNSPSPLSAASEASEGGSVPAALSDVPPESTILSSSSTVTTSGSTGWETVLLPFNAFVRTNHGFVVEPQTSLLRQRVRSVGIGLTDRIEGPYDLRIHKIWATNGISEEDAEEEKRICGPYALPIDEGVRTGWMSEKPHGKMSEDKELSGQQSKARGIKGLKDEWDS